MEYVQERVTTLHDLTDPTPDAPTDRATVVVPMTEREYAGLAAALDAGTVDTMQQYLQYAVVPCTTLLTVMIARSRFASGVEAGLIRGEDFRLDSTLEQETAGIKPGSLHGSRNARVMTAFTGPDDGATAPGPPVAPPLGGPASGTLMPPGEGTAGAAMVPGLASPHGVAGMVGPPADLPPTGTDAAEQGGGPMRTSAGEAPRRLI